MRRAPIVLAATIAGTAAVLSFNPRPAITGAVAEAPLPVTATRVSRGNGIYLGSSVPNRYGAVQVQVAMSGGKIVDVRAVALPDADGESRQINSSAGPQLKQQALQKQTSQVDGVSGATYTSDGYRASLQSALDKAGTQKQRSTGPA